MSEDIETSNRKPAGTGASPPPQGSAGDGASSVTQQGATGAAALQERAAAILQERPEVGVGAAFGGGLILALILKRIAR